MSRVESDRKLYEDLVRRHAADLYRFAHRLCGNAQIAEDLVQDSFCEAWRLIQSLRDPLQARAWLFQILRYRYAHAVRDRSRRVQPTGGAELLDQIAEEPGQDVLDALSNRELLQQALDALEGHYKEPFLMVFLDGLRCREVAEALDLPLGTVLSRIHRARQLLRQSLRRLAESDGVCGKVVAGRLSPTPRQQKRPL
ncbi:MAG: sigma-70 family RNA polymerase sigma factor [Planctomycetia bacterium]|nr:sigma-70 family RNA polymerase sigma factor [Planctomycetia bacterium]